MILLVGPSGSGKTLLLKRLNVSNNCSNYDNLNVENLPSTIPTVGTNLIKVLCGKKGERTIRELGGAMAPIWRNYFSDAKVIMFMIDSSNRCQIATAAIQLLTLMKNDQLQSVPILVVLNKRDLVGRMSQHDYSSITKLNETVHFAKQKVTICETSAKTGEGLNSVIQWLQENIPK